MMQKNNEYKMLITKKNKQKYLEERRQAIKEEYAYPKMICFENTTKYNGIVIVKNIEFSTKCEHHLVHIGGQVHIGYIPNKETLPGLSQVARVVEYFMNPTTEITQEEANQQIADFIQKEANPDGLIVVIKAKHDCICSRGVKQRTAEAITSVIKGNFEDEDVRNEFFKLLELK